MLKKLRGLLPPAGHSPKRHQRQRLIPRLEYLEDHVVPATFTVTAIRARFSHW